MPPILDIVSESSDAYPFLPNLPSFLLLRHPQVMQKLRREIAATCGSNADLTRDDLKRMSYLQNVLKESKSCTCLYQQSHH
jgi:hypothetical protein